MEVKWLRTALTNLDQEAAYIAQHNPVAAANMVQENRLHIGDLP